MAEIDIAASGDKPGVRRRKKLSTKVDLTPMVDLGFLLITFFIFSTKMGEPKGVDLFMPKDSNDSMKLAKSTALTVFPLSNGKIFYYNGELDEALRTNNYGLTTYHVGTGIGQIIRNKQQVMEGMKKNYSDELFLVIKPTEETNYSQLTEMMDEVLINVLKHYAITDMAPQEKELILKLNGSL